MNCFEVGEKEDDLPLSNSNSLCSICASPCFAMDVVTWLWWICSMVTDYCYSLHYLAFQNKTPTICSWTPLEFTTICEQHFHLRQILDSYTRLFWEKTTHVSMIFLLKSVDLDNRFSFCGKFWTHTQDFFGEKMTPCFNDFFF